MLILYYQIKTNNSKYGPLNTLSAVTYQCPKDQSEKGGLFVLLHQEYFTEYLQYDLGNSKSLEQSTVRHNLNIFFKY